MGRGFGFGKAILFNEHFVVHGIPGIVSAIDSIASAVARRTGEGIRIEDERKTAKGYTQTKKIQQKDSISRMLKTMNLDRERTSLKIWGQLWKWKMP